MTITAYERPQPGNPSRHRTIIMITIIGPRDMKKPGTVDTTSHSSADWSTALSPFSLGPVTLYGSRTLASSKTPGNSPSSIQNTQTQTANPPTNIGSGHKTDGTQPNLFAIPSANDANHLLDLRRTTPRLHRGAKTDISSSLPRGRQAHSRLRNVRTTLPGFASKVGLWVDL
jgi:hypothetical protein